MANISVTFSENELRMLKEVQLYRSEQEKLLLSKSDILRGALDMVYNKMIKELGLDDENRLPL